MRRPFALTVLITVWVAASAQAQDERMAGIEKTWAGRLVSEVNDLLARFHNPSSYDSAYIVRPDSWLTLKMRANLSGNSFHARGTVNGVQSKADLYANNKMTVSFAVSYQGLSVAMALNPMKLFGSYQDYELNVNFYSARFSLDASYQRASSHSGDLQRSWAEGNGAEAGTDIFHLERGDAEMRVVNVAAYYAFNYRHFSYPAAFTQSYIQRRSAGSWLTGLAFQGGTIGTGKEAPADMPDMQIKVAQLGVGVGYGYNLVVKDKWLFHLSALPTTVVLNSGHLTVNGERRAAQPIRLNVILNERFSVVYNFSPRYFTSLTGVMSNSIFDDNSLVINQNKWRVRAAFGIRL